MYIPDIFGAYVRGREYAIDRNWNDLKQYEAVEAARNMNDQTALDILRQRAQFGGDMSVFQNNVDASARANQTQEAAHPGMIAKATSGSMAAQDALAAYALNRPQYQQAVYDTFRGNVGQQQVAADALNSYVSNMAPHAGQLGVWKSENDVNTARANNITTGHQPYRAREQNNLWEQVAALESLGNSARMADAQFQFGMLPVTQETSRLNAEQQLEFARNAPARQQGLDVQKARLEIEGLYSQFRQYYNAYLTTNSPADIGEADRLAREIEARTGVNPLLSITQQRQQAVAPPLLAVRNPAPPVAILPPTVGPKDFTGLYSLIPPNAPTR